MLLDEVGGFVCDHDFGAGLGNAQHFVDGFLFCNCLISSSAIKIFSYLFFIFCFPFFLFFSKEKTVNLFLIYCFYTIFYLIDITKNRNFTCLSKYYIFSQCFILHNTIKYLISQQFLHCAVSIQSSELFLLPNI